MNGTTIGASIGTALTSVGFGPVAPIIGSIVGGIVDIFGGGDDGHWEGDKFIPGDLQNRITTVNSWIAQLGLQGKVDWKIIEDYLLTPGVWQDKVRNYLTQLYNDIKSGKTITQPVTTTQIQKTPAPVNENNLPQVINESKIDLNNIILLSLIGAGAYMLLNKKH